VEYDATALADVLPRDAEPVADRVVVTGRLLRPEARITVRCRTASGKLLESGFTLHTRSDATGLVPRYWAQRRAAELSIAPERSHDELVTLGRAFGIVTPGTSLLVLDTLEQHVRHGIEPPVTRPELRAEYLRAAASRKESESRSREEKIERVLARWGDRITWWESEPRAERPAKSPSEPVPAPVIRPTPTPRPAVPCRGPAAAHGRVADVTGAVIPGATVAVTGLRGAVATVTDDGGTFSVCGLSRGDYELRVELAGFRTWSRRLRLPEPRLLDVRLEVGSVSESIEVASLPLLTLAASVTAAGAAATGEDGSTPGPTIAITAWDADMPYLAVLKAAAPGQAYAAYLLQRERYARSPAFYLDCAEFFLARGDLRIGLRVLTSILDLEIEEPRLHRVVAHRLGQLGEVDLAVDLFERVARLRPEEPQSFRDLALALAARADASRAGTGDPTRAGPDYVRALALLDEVVMGEWDGRFPDVETIALMDANRILEIMRRERLPGIERVTLHPKLRRLLDVDVRIVLTWDTDQTDMDLWVTEPSGEKCDYSHNRTASGGRMSADFTGGYGPEEYLLRRSPRGTYRIEANYYGSRAPSLTGPTTVQATVVTDFGRAQERRRTLTLRLADAKDVVQIGEVAFEGVTTAP
jgi:hypothetical protein